MNSKKGVLKLFQQTFKAIIFGLAGWFILFGCAGDSAVVGVYLQDGEPLGEGALVPFLMEQNYPNPFNPTTTIAFETATSVPLKLTVYTEDWVEVETILDATVFPGNYQVQFNPDDDVPSGEYFYVMESGDYVQIRKMNLLK